MNSRFLFTALLSLLCCGARAQLGIGTRISLLHPTADIGPYYKKAPCYELLLVAGDSPQERFRQRIGLMYTSLQPRLDSFPTFGYKGGNDPVFFPGRTSFGNLTLVMVYIGLEVKTLQFGHFTWYNGLNLAVGYVMSKYSREVETLLTEQGDINQIAGGFIFRTAFEYQMAKRISLSAELSKSSIVPSKWTPGYGHYNYGIGITYHLNPDDE